MAAYPGDAPFIPQAPASAGRAWIVTPSDDDDLPATTRALYVGDTGDVTVLMAGVDNTTPADSKVLFAAVPAGTTLPIACTRVLDTGTDSTNIVALW